MKVLRKALSLVLVTMFLMLCFGGFVRVKAAEEVYKTALFGSTYNSSGISSYTSTFDSTNDEFTVQLDNFNNNNNGWSYVKCGRKNNASVALITTTSSIDKPISKVVVTVDAVTTSKVNSFKLYVASDSGFTKDVQTISVDIAADDITFNVPDPVAYRYYKLEVDCQSNTSNGFVTISKIDYYKTDDIACTGVALDSAAETKDPGVSFDLTATISPATATDRRITWTSNNPGVATVNASGRVTTVAEGVATITATTTNGSFTASCVVTVLAATLVPVTGVSLDVTSDYLFVGETLQLTETVAPVDATDKTVNWSSTDSTKASVASGLVTAVAAGDATITVTTVDGGFTATCDVEVRALPANNTVVSIKDAKKIAKACGEVLSANNYIAYGTVTEKASNYFDLSDGVEAIRVYKASHGFSNGDKVKVTGKLTNFNSTTLEFNNPTIQQYFDVTFNSNGGSSVDAQRVLKNGSVIEPFIPTKAGYTFIVWKNGVTAWDFSLDKVNSDLTLTAEWISDALYPTYTELCTITSSMNLGFKYHYEKYTEVLTRETTGVSGSSYVSWSNKKTESNLATYAGSSAGGNDSIQLRSSNSSGIITTVSGYYVAKIEVAWNSNTADGRVLDIYGSNTAYTGTSDLYSDATKGTKLGSITYGKTTELVILEQSYKYIGIRSSSGALYLDSITITWEEYTDVDFRLAIGVSSDLTSITGVDEYGIEVSDDHSHVKRYSSKTSLVLSLGDLINNINRIDYEFSVRAYVKVGEEYIYSSEVTTHKPWELVQNYYVNKAVLGLTPSQEAAVDALRALFHAMGYIL